MITWNEAMEQARDELGYYPNQYIKDWDGLVETAREIYEYSKEEDYEQFCCDAYNDYQEYLQSDEWKAKRIEVLERDNYSCGDCETRATEVHHVNYENLHTEKEIEFCISLCGQCHRKRHEGEK